MAVSPARERRRARNGSGGSNGHEDPAYGRQYFEHYRLATGKVAYERNEQLRKFFGVIADHIVNDINPNTVLDAGCAMGFLVEALRDRGVEAFGVDISEYAIERVRDDIKPYCWQGSVTDPLKERYDLVVCIEVLEHLPAEEAIKAVANLCSATSDIIFSSTPGDHEEPTHLNVQPPEWWTEVFAQQGFFRDVDYDPTTYLSPWAIRYRKTRDTIGRTVAGYERLAWRLKTENQALRDAAHDLREQLERMQHLAAELAAIKQSSSYRVMNIPRAVGKRLFPYDSPRGRWLRSRLAR